MDSISGHNTVMIPIVDSFAPQCGHSTVDCRLVGIIVISESGDNHYMGLMLEKLLCVCGQWGGSFVGT